MILQYATHTAKVKSEYCSITDYVLVRFLGYSFKEVEVIDTAIDPNKPILKKQAIRDPPPSKKIQLWPNDFPYYFTSNIDHLILWSQTVLSQEEIDRNLDVLLKERYGDAPIEVKMFVNTVALQSIREVFHVHVLVKRG